MISSVPAEPGIDTHAHAAQDRSLAPIGKDEEARDRRPEGPWLRSPRAVSSSSLSTAARHSPVASSTAREATRETSAGKSTCSMRKIGQMLGSAQVGERHDADRAQRYDRESRRGSRSFTTLLQNIQGPEYDTAGDRRRSAPVHRLLVSPRSRSPCQPDPAAAPSS